MGSPPARRPRSTTAAPKNILDKRRRIQQWHVQTMRRRSLLLWVIFLVSFCLTLKSSSDALPGWLRGTRLAPWLCQFSTGNQNTHDIAVGIIVSLFIYLLVVRLPERDKRKRVRRNLQLQYNSFKEGCVTVFLNAMGQGYDPALIDCLKDKDQFKQFFMEAFSSEQTRWDAVANGLDAENIKALLRLMWSVFAGWSFIEGYTKKDVIDDMIEAM